ncbi:MAG: hypothetical protein PHX51_00305 [Clostridia bacterium]|nr:hypothetical protein [Clostridia bacterium]
MKNKTPLCLLLAVAAILSIFCFSSAIFGESEDVFRAASRESIFQVYCDGNSIISEDLDYKLKLIFDYDYLIYENGVVYIYTAEEFARYSVLLELGQAVEVLSPNALVTEVDYDEFASATVRFMGNVDLVEYCLTQRFTGIGSLGHPFKAQIDGNAYILKINGGFINRAEGETVIKNLFVRGDLTSFVGYAESLSIVDCDIEVGATPRSSGFSGSIAARANTVFINNCRIEAAVYVDGLSSAVGGLIGCADSVVISDSALCLSVIGRVQTAGGICADVTELTMSDCVYTLASSEDICGIAVNVRYCALRSVEMPGFGFTMFSEADRVELSAVHITTSDGIGALVAPSLEILNVTDCYVYSEFCGAAGLANEVGTLTVADSGLYLYAVDSDGDCGGMARCADTVALRNTVVCANLNGSSCGAVASDCNSLTADNCTIRAVVPKSTSLGGFVANMHGNVRVNGCRVDVAANSDCGGAICGTVFNGKVEVTDCRFKVDLNCYRAGGLFGCVEYSTTDSNICVSNIEVSGSISASIEGGGVCGRLSLKPSENECGMHIESVFADVTFTCKLTGGLIGYMSGESGVRTYIGDCGINNDGKSYTSERFGGIIGQTEGNFVSVIENNSVCGVLIKAYDGGGAVGKIVGSPELTLSGNAFCVEYDRLTGLFLMGLVAGDAGNARIVLRNNYCASNGIDGAVFCGGEISGESITGFAYNYYTKVYDGERAVLTISGDFDEMSYTFLKDGKEDVAIDAGRYTAVIDCLYKGERVRLKLPFYVTKAQTQTQIYSVTEYELTGAAVNKLLDGSQSLLHSVKTEYELCGEYILNESLPSGDADTFAPDVGEYVVTAVYESTNAVSRVVLNLTVEAKKLTDGELSVNLGFYQKELVELCDGKQKKPDFYNRKKLAVSVRYSGKTTTGDSYDSDLYPTSAGVYTAILCVQAEPNYGGKAIDAASIAITVKARELRFFVESATVYVSAYFSPRVCLIGVQSLNELRQVFVEELVLPSDELCIDEVGYYAIGVNGRFSSTVFAVTTESGSITVTKREATLNQSDFALSVDGDYLTIIPKRSGLIFSVDGSAYSAVLSYSGLEEGAHTIVAKSVEDELYFESQPFIAEFSVKKKLTSAFWFSALIAVVVAAAVIGVPMWIKFRKKSKRD